MKKEVKTIARECALLAAIISDEYIRTIYEGKHEGYIAALDVVADLAIEFYDKYKDVGWGEVFEDEDAAAKIGLPRNCDCWDDAVMGWAGHRLNCRMINGIAHPPKTGGK